MSDDPYELNKRIRKVQAELDDIDRLERAQPGRLLHLREAVEERLDELLTQHRERVQP